MEVSLSGTYKIRPAGRHILTIGKDLIQNSYAAVVELVKNAYDADSPDVQIEFQAGKDKNSCTIQISDHGHGMSRDTVINQWMVPSTQNKLDRKKSPSGRIMQGSKGIGRYAASVLGTDLLLETVTSEGKKTTVLLEWKAFEDAKYLDDVEILIETTEVREPPGTRLSITGDNETLSEWDDKQQFKKLQFELKKLVSPVGMSSGERQDTDDFHIHLKVNGFSEVQNIDESVQPFPIFDLFDYRISGKVASDGKNQLTYELQKARNTTEENIEIDTGGPTGCGELVFDIRVYDRDKESIESLIGRGLKDESGNYVGKLDARKLLTDYSGIAVYRNGFRIRPLGDADFDWLELNKERVQNPSLRIGSDQVIGYVQIQSEASSGLTEKSARDGLRENTAFTQLKNITEKVIAKLEQRRFDYRKQAGLSRSAFTTAGKLERLGSADTLKKDVRSLLTKAGVDTVTVEGVTEVIDHNTENRNKVTEEIRQAIAIYQGQATLGKIITVILHEGRSPLNYFRNAIPRLRKWYDSFIKNDGSDKFEKPIRIIEGVWRNMEVFVKLFRRLDPLAARRWSSQKLILLKSEIQNSLEVFEEEMKIQQVAVRIDGPDDFRYMAWQQDIYAIFTNLVDNSLYWMNEKSVQEKNIVINIVIDKDSLLHIDYRDMGPGIEPYLIASKVIFEPEFSTKPSGTGLGLAIAGEAAQRNGMELKAIESEKGAWFSLECKEEGS